MCKEHIRMQTGRCLSIWNLVIDWLSRVMTAGTAAVVMGVVWWKSSGREMRDA